MLRRLCERAVRVFLEPASLCIAQSSMLAICLATWWVQLTALLGTSIPAVLALSAVATVGCALGIRPSRPPDNSFPRGLANPVIFQFAVAGWIVASPWMIELIDTALLRPGTISLTSPTWNLFVLFALAAPLLGFPAYLASRSATGLIVGGLNGPHRLACTFLGATAGIAAWGVGLAQVLSPYYCALAAAGLALALTFISSVLKARFATESTAADASMTAPLEPEDPDLWSIVTNGAVSLALGGWLAALGRLTAQLVPATVYLDCAGATGLCAGLALGAFCAGWQRSGARQIGRMLALCGTAIWGVALLAAFPLLIDLALWFNACISDTTLLVLARGCLAAVVVMPVGLAAATWFYSAGNSTGAWRSRGLQIALAATWCGYAAVSTLALGRFPLETIVVALAWLTVAAAAPRIILSRPALLATWPMRVVAGIAMVVIVLAPLWRFNFTPRTSAKLLFNSNAAYAYRSGVKPALLTVLDEGRAVTATIGDRGIFTVWKYGGHQLQIRENGFPRGVVSTDPRTFPRYAPESLQIAVPCVLFGQTERLLIMGLGSSESLAAALSFPIPEIVCLESDAGMVGLVRDVICPELGTNLLDDDRVALSVCDPVLGLSSAPGQFDVIVSSPENPVLAQTQACLTAEFYRRAARKLSTNGVFCQRLQHIDLGPRTVRSIARTLQSVFRDVLAIEVAPGEMLLTATNSDDGLIRAGLMGRMELPHVRAVLADAGLDWTVLVNIGALNREQLQEFTRQVPGAINTASNGRLPFLLPRDAMRWGAKMQELHEAVDPLAGRLATWMGPEANSPALVRRLAEVQGQQELMTTYSDQFWAYRASLRDQVKEKPRSQIQQVSATDDERKMHPEDRRRLKYFTALGRAVQTGRAADIERLVRFADPYDPLISFFVHEEAAEIFSRSSERDCAQELRHRLYAVFYSSPRDASLRNVVAALKLLREHPESEPDPQARWDDMNALLQALKMRWEARIGVRPTNIREAVNDIDTTVLATEQTFRTLEALTVAAGLPAELWAARKSALEKTLIRPVRTYQLELVPLLHRRTASSDEKLQPDEKSQPLEEQPLPVDEEPQPADSE